MFQSIKKFLVVPFIATVMLTGCKDESKKSTEHNDDHNHVSKKTLIVGTSADFVPFEFLQNGQIVGFDIDLIKAVAEKLNMDVVIKDMKFFALIPSLQNGDVNVIVAGLSENPSRKEQIDFSKPYYFNKFAMISKGDVDHSDPIKPGMRIGVQTGTVMHKWIDKEDLGVEVVTMDGNLELIEDLKSGRLHGVLLDELSVRDIIEANPGHNLTAVALAGVEDAGISIGLQKDSELKKSVNDALDSLENEGKLKEIKNRWGM